MSDTKNNYKVSLGLKDHYVICNWSNIGDSIIRQLHDTSLERINSVSPIIIITDKPERIPNNLDKEYEGVLVIIGDPATQSILKRAEIEKARSVLILAEDDESDKADNKSTMIALAVDSICSSVHTVVEIMNSKNKLYLKYTNADEIVCVEEIGGNLLAQSAMTPGISKVYMDLLTQSESSEFYQVDIPDTYLNHSYSEFKNKIFSKQELEVILVGFITIESKMADDGSAIINGHGNERMEQKVYINPNNQEAKHKFIKGDQVIVIAYDKPDFSGII